jgi:hypothetical protein
VVGSKLTGVGKLSSGRHNSSATVGDAPDPAEAPPAIDSESPVLGGPPEGALEPAGGAGSLVGGAAGSSEHQGGSSQEGGSGSSEGGTSGSSSERGSSGSSEAGSSGSGEEAGSGSGEEESGSAGGSEGGSGSSEGGAGSSSGTEGGSGSAESSGAPSEPPAPFRFFSPTSFWNEAVPTGAPLDPSSAAVMGAFDKEVATTEQENKNTPGILTTAWSVPIYTVPADQPNVKVTLEGSSSKVKLQMAWDAVPLPPGAQPAAGTDKHLVVWQPSTDRLWEFWRLEKTEDGWQAAHGGAIEKASSNSGAYNSEAWAGATRWWGASASSLAVAGGLITLEDLERGEINHALAISIPNVRAGVYASPAQRTDGKSTSPLSLPEGAHLRLDPSLDLAALHLPRLTLMIAKAAQRYGIFVRDRAGNMAFYAQDPIPIGTEPYTGAHGYFEGKATGRLLASFPWSHLQLLKMGLHRIS